VRPPFHLVDFVEVDGDFFAGGGGFERPGGFVGVDWVGEVALLWDCLSPPYVSYRRRTLILALALVQK